jgi:hypothetical protein
MIEVIPQQSGRVAIGDLAKLLRAHDTGNGTIAGSTGHIASSDAGLLVIPGPSASPSKLLQLWQAGLLTDLPWFLLARMPEPDEIALLRQLLGLGRQTV